MYGSEDLGFVLKLPPLITCKPATPRDRLGSGRLTLQFRSALADVSPDSIDTIPSQVPRRPSRPGRWLNWWSLMTSAADFALDFFWRVVKWQEWTTYGAHVLPPPAHYDALDMHQDAFKSCPTPETALCYSPCAKWVSFRKKEAARVGISWHDYAAILGQFSRRHSFENEPRADLN